MDRESSAVGRCRSYADGCSGHLSQPRRYLVCVKAPSPSNTYGYVRLEILAALANGVLLLSMAAFILYEAYRRMWSPPEVLAGPMLTIAVVGLGVNLASMWLLHRGANESLNLRGAYFEVLGDAMASLGVIAAALIIQFTGWTLADPLISGAIGLFILPRTWNLIKQAVQILMEGVPPHLDVREIETAMRTSHGVRDVHDLHVSDTHVRPGSHERACVGG